VAPRHNAPDIVCIGPRNFPHDGPWWLVVLYWRGVGGGTIADFDLVSALVVGPRAYLSTNIQFTHFGFGSGAGISEVSVGRIAVG